MFADVTLASRHLQDLKGIIGAEDIAVDRQSGLVFSPQRPPRQPALPGDGIYTLSLDHPEGGIVHLAGAPPDFHPRISLFRAADGSFRPEQ